VYRSIDDELLWSSSMPCMLGQTIEGAIATYMGSRTSDARRTSIGADLGGTAA
jgi:gamma-glutamylcysteine synthetase